MSENPPRDATAYAQQLRQLLPRGAAWAIPPGGIFARLLLALGEEFARIDGRALDLIEEADPRTALELLPDWERVAALPDECMGAPDNVVERQLALQDKLTRTGSLSRRAFTEMAARLGYVIEIEEHRPARLGMTCTGPLNSAEWAFVWTVHVRPLDGYFAENSFVAIAKIGDRLGVRLRGFGVLDLECLIGRAAPAHTIVLFAYDIEPEADFWMDFTQ